MTYRLFFFDDKHNETAKTLPILELPFPPQLFDKASKERTQDIINMIKGEIVPIIPRNPIFDNPEREAVMALLHCVHDHEFHIIDNETDTICYYGIRPKLDEEELEEAESVEDNTEDKDVDSLTIVEVFRERRKAAERLAKLDARIKTEVNQEIDTLVAHVDNLERIRDFWITIRSQWDLVDTLTLDDIEHLNQVNQTLKKL